MFLKKLSILVILGVSILLACDSNRPHLSTPSPNYVKAIAFWKSHPDSAFYYFNKEATTSHDSLQIARAYNCMAQIQSESGDHFGAQESLVQSLHFLHEQKQQDQHCLAGDYNELGITSNNLNDYDLAIQYFDKALFFDHEQKFKLNILNNKAISYQKKRDYNKALTIYNEIMRFTKPEGKAYAQLLTNMVTTQWRQNFQYNPVPELLRALQIRLKESDLNGVNSSYAHLTDFYLSRKQDSALFYANHWYSQAQKIGSPEDKLSALSTLIKLKPLNNIRRYFTEYKYLSDSLQTARSATKNQFALIRYNVQKHMADNLKLQQENIEKRYQLIWLVIFIIVGTGFTVLWNRKLQFDNRERLQKNELRLSKRVHDVVANGIYRVMNELEYAEDVNKEYLLDQLEVMYDQSRDISHEKDELSSDDFTNKINKLLNAFKSNSLKLGVSNNDPALWNLVSEPIKNELELVLQELMVNMAKHSQADQALLSFELKNIFLVVDYRDNGIGLRGTNSFGNGLQNTVSRMESLGGKVTFGTQAEKGTHLQITIPLAQ
jgi:signal transduction histidine kinase